MKHTKHEHTSNCRTIILLSVAYLSMSLLSTPVLADKAVAKSLSTNTGAVKNIKARNSSDLKRAFRIASTDNHSALVVTCHPPEHKWCAGEFQTACEDMGGGVGTEPDGGISCSVDAE